MARKPQMKPEARSLVPEMTPTSVQFLRLSKPSAITVHTGDHSASPAGIPSVTHSWLTWSGCERPRPRCRSPRP